MVIFYNYHMNNVSRLALKHPEQKERVREDYLFCLENYVSGMVRDVMTKKISYEYMRDVIDSVEKTPRKRIQNLFFR